MTYFVYGLFDSGNWDRIRYIGAASWLGRPAQHITQALNRNGERRITRRCNGIRKVYRENRHIGWKILDVADSWIETLTLEISRHQTSGS